MLNWKYIITLITEIDNYRTCPTDSEYSCTLVYICKMMDTFMQKYQHKKRFIDHQNPSP